MSYHNNNNCDFGKEIIRITNATEDIRRKVLFNLKKIIPKDFHSNHGTRTVKDAQNFLFNLQDPEKLIDSKIKETHPINHNHPSFKKIIDVIKTLNDFKEKVIIKQKENDKDLYCNENKSKERINLGESRKLDFSLDLKSSVINNNNNNNTTTCSTSPMIQATITAISPTLSSPTLSSPILQSSPSLTSTTTTTTTTNSTTTTTTSKVKEQIEFENLNNMEKYLNELYNGINEMINYYQEYMNQLVNYSKTNRIQEFLRLLDSKATITSETFESPFYRIPRSIALHILEMDEFGERPIKRQGQNHYVSILKDNKNTNCTCYADKANCLKHRSEIESDDGFWNSCKTIYFKNNGNPPLECGKEMLIYQLYKLLNIPIPPIAMIVIDQLILPDSKRGPREYFINGENESPFYIQASWGIEGKEVNYNMFRIGHPDFKILNLNSFAKQVFGVLLTCPSDGKSQNFIMVQHDRSPSFNLISIDNDQVFEDSIQAFKTSSSSSLTFTTKTATTATKPLQEIQKYRIHLKSLLLALPEMNCKFPELLQEFVKYINPQFLIIDWLTKLEHYNEKYLQLIEAVQFIRSKSYYSNFSMTTTTSPTLPINNETITSNFQDFKVPIKLNKKLVDQIQRRLEIIQNHLKSNPECTISDLFSKVYPIAHQYYNEKLKIHQNNPLEIISLIYNLGKNNGDLINESFLISGSNSSSSSSSSSGGDSGCGISNLNEQQQQQHQSFDEITTSSSSISNSFSIDSELSSSISSSSSNSISMVSSQSTEFLMLPNQLINSLDIDRKSIGENVVEDIVSQYNNNKSIQLDVVYNRLTILNSIRANHFKDSKSVIKLYQIIKSINKNNNNDNNNEEFIEKFKPIFNQFSIENPSLKLDWSYLIEDWFPMEWNDNQKKYPTSSNEMKGIFFGRKLIPKEMHYHLFTRDGQFIRRNKYGRKDVSWYPEKDPVWYFKKYPEIPGYEYAAIEFMKGLGLKNTSQSELVLFYDPNVGKCYPVLMSLAVPGKLVKEYWSDDDNFMLLDPHHTGLLIVSSILLSVEDGKEDNFILSPDGKYLTPIDNDHCFIPSSVWEKNFISVLHEKLMMKSILFSLPIMNSWIATSVKKQITSIDLNQFLKDWLDKLVKLHHLFQELLPSNEIDQLYSEHGTILRIPISLETIKSIYLNLYNLSHFFRNSMVNSYFDLLKRLDPFVGGKYQSLFSNTHYKCLEDRFKFITNGLFNQTTLPNSKESIRETALNSRQIVKIINIPTQDLVGESAKIKTDPSFALNHLKHLIQSHRDIKKNNTTLLGSGEMIYPENFKGQKKSKQFEILSESFAKNEQFAAYGLSLSDGYFDRLRTSHIQFLDLRNCELLTNKAIEQIIRLVPKLLYLNITGWKSLKSICFSHCEYPFDISKNLKQINPLDFFKYYSENPTKIQKTLIERLVINDCPSLELVDLYFSTPFLKKLDLNRNAKLEKIVGLNYDVVINSSSSSNSSNSSISISSNCSTTLENQFSTSKKSLQHQTIISKRLLNIIVIGDKGVGKSSIIDRLKEIETFPEIIFHETTFDIGFSNQVDSEINSRINCFCFYRFFIFVVYDSPSSFINSTNWIKSFKSKKNFNSIPIALIGNKDDLYNESGHIDFSNQYHLINFQKSTKNDVSFYDLFNCFIGSGKNCPNENHHI
ncbi:hypothetical protein ACTFIU_003331 [Dictyostelium citrinum]